MRRNINELTDKTVLALDPPAKGYQLYFDSKVAGFGVRVTAAGARAYILNYRANGIERRLTIGAVGEWQCATARAEAKRLKKEVYFGDDPLAAKQARRELMTMGELLDEYERDYFPRLRKSSLKPYGNAVKAIRKEWKNKPVVELTHAEVDTFHARLSRATPVLANTTLSVLSRALSIAVRRGHATTNVAKGVERNPNVARERYLTQAEIETLSKTLERWSDVRAANVIRLLLLTGARKGEVLAMRWEHLDLASALWVKPASLTKQKRVHRVPLSSAAVALLESIPREGECVFPSRESHLRRIESPWAAICKACKLEDFRIHDLRHTYASVLIGTGLSLAIVGKLLGHSQPQTTARYAHLADDPLREATERAAAIIAG